MKNVFKKNLAENDEGVELGLRLKKEKTIRKKKEFYRSLQKILKKTSKARDLQRKNNPYRPPEARKVGGKIKRGL